MKVYEMSFRDMDQKMVEIHGMKMVKLLEKMGLKLDLSLPLLSFTRSGLFA